MSARTIQGLFVGGRPSRGAVGMTGAARIAQANGAAESFPIDPARIGLAPGGGRPLPAVVRGQMERALGADFSGVRVHVGPQAERIGAIAFTVGADIYFAPGRFQPETVHGQQLLGHELAHVVQQRQGRVRAPGGSGMAVVQDRALEAEADRLGHRAAALGATALRKPQLKLQSSPARTQAAAGVRVVPRALAADGRSQITAEAGTRRVGSVMVRARANAIELTDLGVEPASRRGGVGGLLLASAARAGMLAGRSTVRLAAEDNGSGRLTRWYMGMGFACAGVDAAGLPVLEAPANRLAAALPYAAAHGGAVQRAAKAKAADKLRRQKQQAVKDQGQAASQASKDIVRAPKVSGFVAKAAANEVRKDEFAAEASTLASTWRATINAVYVQVRALRTANPAVAGINAGTNHGVGNTAGGTTNPVTLTLSATAIRLGISKSSVGSLIGGFDNSDSGAFKFRSGDTPPILVHAS